MHNPFEDDPFVREGEKLLTDKQINSFLDRINRRLSGESKHVKFSPWKWFAVAASIVLLISGGLFFNAKEQSLEQVASELMDTTPLSSTMAAKDFPADLQSLRNQAAAFYKQRKFQQALSVFEQLKDLQPADPEYTMYIGDVYLKMGKLDLAKKNLNQALERYQSLDKHNGIYCTRFYLSVTLLLQGDTQAARILLEKTVNTKGGMEEKARQLLEEI